MSGFIQPNVPNLTDFTTFVMNALAPITTEQLPANSPYLGYALQGAQGVVNPAIRCIPCGPYVIAVYNLGTDMLINWCPDQTGQTFFQTLRGPPPKGFGIYNFVPGVVASAADVSTSDSLVTPDFMTRLTLANLQQLKTPFGRQYLAIAQSMGTLWGLS